MPITLISCSARPVIRSESTIEVGVQDRVDLRRPHDALEDRVGRVGPHELGALERQPRLAGVEPDDRARPPDRLELLREAAAPEGAEPGDEDAHAGAQPNQTLRRVAQHVVERVLDGVADLLRLLHHQRRGCSASWSGGDVEVHGRQHADPELRREARSTRPRTGPNTSMLAVIGKYGTFSSSREPVALGRGSASTPRCRRPRSGRRARRRASRSRRSRRARSGAAGSGRGTCLPVRLGALGEHERELLVVVQEPVRVVGVRGHAAGARPQRADDRERPEQVLGEPVDRAPELGLDAVHDHGRVRRDRAAVVGDQQRAAVAGDVLEALPLGPEPVPVDRVVEPRGRCARSVLAAAPGVDVARAIAVVRRGQRSGRGSGTSSSPTGVGEPRARPRAPPSTSRSTGLRVHAGQ